MKKCPVCEKEFDDNLRFCQVDGTPLVDKAEDPAPADPYKTMVARKEDVAAAIPKETSPAPSSVVPPIPSPLEDQLLEIPPANDPNKTQFVSEAELRAEMEAHPDNQVIDVPPATESATSDIPITGDSEMSPPPSPFSAPPAEESGPANFPTSPPIPSPFSSNEPKASPAPEPPTPKFAEPNAPSAVEPAAQAAPMAQAEFNTPSTQEPNMQNPQNFGQQQFTPPASTGQNKTLAIVSLISGIAGLTICCGWFLPSLLGVVLGFMAKGKANQNPAEYGGSGLAMGGIITGAIGIVGGIIAWIIYVFYFAAIMANMPR